MNLQTELFQIQEYLITNTDLTSQNFLCINESFEVFPSGVSCLIRPYYTDLMENKFSNYRKIMKKQNLMFQIFCKPDDVISDYTAKISNQLLSSNFNIDGIQTVFNKFETNYTQAQLKIQFNKLENLTEVQETTNG